MCVCLYYLPLLPSLQKATLQQLTEELGQGQWTRRSRELDIVRVLHSFRGRLRLCLVVAWPLGVEMSRAVFPRDFVFLGHLTELAGISQKQFVALG